MSDKPGCSKRVFHGTDFRGSPCLRNGVIKRDGKWFCRQHDPEEVAKRRAAWDAKHNAERNAAQAIDNEAKDIGKALGCSACADRDYKFNRMRAVVITFDDAYRLIARLKGKP